MQIPVVVEFGTQISHKVSLALTEFAFYVRLLRSAHFFILYKRRQKLWD